MTMGLFHYGHSVFPSLDALRFSPFPLFVCISLSLSFQAGCSGARALHCWNYCLSTLLKSCEHATFLAGKGFQQVSPELYHLLFFFPEHDSHFLSHSLTRLTELGLVSPGFCSPRVRKPHQGEAFNTWSRSFWFLPNFGLLGIMPRGSGNRLSYHFRSYHLRKRWGISHSWKYNEARDCSAFIQSKNIQMRLCRAHMLAGNLVQSVNL